MIVEYLDGEPNGLASMLGRLIEANLERNPARIRHLGRGCIAVRALDIGLATTLTMAPGRVSVSNGNRGRPEVRVRGDSLTLLRLTDTPLRFGFPNLLSREGRALARKVLSGNLKIRGMLRHPLEVARLNRLLSVR